PAMALTHAGDSPTRTDYGQKQCETKSTQQGGPAGRFRVQAVQTAGPRLFNDRDDEEQDRHHDTAADGKQERGDAEPGVLQRAEFVIDIVAIVTHVNPNCSRL